MTLKAKILIGYGVAFAFMGLVVAWAVTNLVSLGKATDAILHENYRSILAAENMVDELERQDSGILIMFLGAGEKGIDQFRESAPRTIQRFKARRNSSNPSRPITPSTDDNFPG